MFRLLFVAIMQQNPKFHMVEPTTTRLDTKLIQTLERRECLPSARCLAETQCLGAIDGVSHEKWDCDVWQSLS
jgi:hypothetical protein